MVDGDIEPKSGYQQALRSCGLPDIRERSASRISRDPPDAPFHCACFFKSSGVWQTIRLPIINSTLDVCNVCSFTSTTRVASKCPGSKVPALSVKLSKLEEGALAPTAPGTFAPAFETSIRLGSYCVQT